VQTKIALSRFPDLDILLISSNPPNVTS